MITGFSDRVSALLQAPLVSAGLQSLQVSVGYKCNMACRHCHVSAGPDRPETMQRPVIDRILAVLGQHDIKTIDITGGAPELNPFFTCLVTGAKKAGCHVIVRSNLTIFFENGFEHMPDFYSEHDIEITASLPCYLGANVDMTRGEGTFHKSIEALRRLNSLGYGTGKGMRRLNLVYNPSGAFLAPEQKALEEDYRSKLANQHGIQFDRLYVFSNMPVGRFRAHLEETGYLADYLKLLENSFNPATLKGLMCRHLISVAWDGALYDCDFNQALGLHMHDACPRHIRDFDFSSLSGREIRMGDHCYGCTAGQGST